MDDLAAREVPNYKSIHGYEEQVLKLFREEEKEGWTTEMTDKDAEEEFGSKLHVAALAVVVKADKIRVVHDGTNKVQVNNCIQVRDQARSPTAAV